MKKGHRGILRLIFSRTGIILLLLLLNFAILFSGFIWFESFLPQIYGASIAISLIMLLYLINSELDPNAKLIWLILIMMMPVFGSLLYFFTINDMGHRALARRYRQVTEDISSALEQDDKVAESFSEAHPGSAEMAAYVRSTGCYPVYDGTALKYFRSGEEMYASMLEELNKAEKFIFLEFFIVDEGIMWGNILDVLAKKAAQGVEVRVMYDGTCEFFRLPRSYPDMLKKLGIDCRAFAPVSPFVSTHYNFRDHRKILVIDGKTAYTGGVNLADEYINRIERFGHWKDTGLMLSGKAVSSFTLMFLQMWHMSDSERMSNMEMYPYITSLSALEEETSGFVMPYGDSPVDNERVGHQVYLDIINRAHRYVHIMTPYLILDTEMENALKYAAKRGVDVRIILPGIPDKPVPYAIAKTHYKALLAAGVRVYEYTPGFLHAKVFVSDDKRAVVGTINLDYRSLSHHFECAAYMEDVPCIADIEQDMRQTQEKCRRVDAKDLIKEKFSVWFIGRLLKVMSPLL